MGNKYRIGRKIGSGSFGDIYLGKSTLLLLSLLLHPLLSLLPVSFATQPSFLFANYHRLLKRPYFLKENIAQQPGRLISVGQVKKKNIILAPDLSARHRCVLETIFMGLLAILLCLFVDSSHFFGTGPGSYAQWVFLFPPSTRLSCPFSPFFYLGCVSLMTPISLILD